MLHFARRIENVQNPVIPIVAEWIAKHPGTISLGQGVVHYGPPPEVRRAVHLALDDDMGLDRYGSVLGLERLLERIRSKVSAENHVDLREQSVLVTAGSNMAFLTAVLAIGDVGDEVIVPSPYYFNQHMAIEIAGCRPVPVPTMANYQLDLPAISAALTPRTRAIVTVSPNNPTGAVYSRQSLTAINELCRRQGCYHISDEAYEYFTYGGVHHFSPASLPDAAEHTISLFSFSKAYGMAGWRCGYMLVPQQLEVAIKKILDTNLICTPQICQLAALAALSVGREWVADKTASLSQTRSVVMQELDQLRPSCLSVVTDGAFYVLIKLDTQMSDLELVHALIREAGVAALPGSTFGVSEGCCIRISFGGLGPEKVAAGMQRLRTGLVRVLKLSQ